MGALSAVRAHHTYGATNWLSGQIKDLQSKPLVQQSGNVVAHHTSLVVCVWGGGYTDGCVVLSRCVQADVSRYMCRLVALKRVQSGGSIGLCTALLWYFSDRFCLSSGQVALISANVEKNGFTTGGASVWDVTPRGVGTFGGL